MRKIWSASLLALATTFIGGAADATSFSYTGAIQTYTVASSGFYSFDVAGAQGGSGFDALGGLGAEVGGRLFLSAGTTLNIVVGGRGGVGVDLFDNAVGAGGGGGSFVYTGPSNPLFVAGGGGGTFWYSNGGVAAGGPGQISRSEWRG